MKPRLLVLLLLAPSLAGAADSPRMFFRGGLAAYEKKDYEKAAQQFGQAASGATTNRLDPAVPLYNAANALMQLGRHEEASRQYQEALRSPDLALQGLSYYNRGNALYKLAEAPAPDAGANNNAASAIGEALRMYERALFLNPNDEDAKVNYELALRLKEQIERQQKQQQQQNQQKQDKQQQDQEKNQEQQPKENKEQEKKPQQPDQGQDKAQEQPANQEPTPAQQMTPEEARMLLDRMKQEEQAYRDQMSVIMGQPVPVDKDW